MRQRLDISEVFSDIEKWIFGYQKIILDNAKYGFFVKSEINFRYQKFEFLI